jgi:hypothetical protein
LNRILLKPPEDLVKSGAEIQLVKTKRSVPLHARFREQSRVQRPKFDVLQFFAMEGALQRINYFLALLKTIYERFAMVGKGQGNYPVAGQPTTNAAEGDSIPQGLSRSGGCVRDRFVSVSVVQCPQPAGRVKNGGMRVPLNKVVPARIVQRI